MSDEESKTDYSLIKVEVNDLTGAEHWAKQLAPIAEAMGKSIPVMVEGCLDLVNTLFGPAAESFGQLLGDKINGWRAANAISIAVRLQERMKAAGLAFPAGQYAHPRVVLEFLEKGTRVPEKKLQEMWAGLLQRSISAGAEDDSTLTHMKILDGLTSTQAAILKYACDECPKNIEPLASDPNELIISLNQLQYKFPGRQLGDFTFDILHLRQLDLLVRIMSDHAFQLKERILDQLLIANISPSIRGLQFISACEGLYPDHLSSKDSHP